LFGFEKYYRMWIRKSIVMLKGSARECVGGKYKDSHFGVEERNKKRKG